jgi:hypothetical protein
MQLLTHWAIFLATFLLGGVILTHWPNWTAQAGPPPASVESGMGQVSTRGTPPPQGHGGAKSPLPVPATCRQPPIQVAGFRPVPQCLPARASKSGERRRGASVGRASQRP